METSCRIFFCWKSHPKVKKRTDIFWTFRGHMIGDKIFLANVPPAPPCPPPSPVLLRGGGGGWPLSSPDYRQQNGNVACRPAHLPIDTYYVFLTCTEQTFTKWISLIIFSVLRRIPLFFCSFNNCLNKKQNIYELNFSNNIFSVKKNTDVVPFFNSSLNSSRIYPKSCFTVLPSAKVILPSATFPLFS